MTEEQRAVYEEVTHERDRQDAKWGGAEHDNQHDPLEWAVILQERVAMAYLDSHSRSSDYRRRLVQVAALAVAAIETFDRQVARNTEEDRAIHKGA